MPMLKLIVRKETVFVPDLQATGQQVRDARQKAGMSLRAAARALGISAPYLSDMERGRRGWHVGYLSELSRIFKDATK